MSATPTQVRDTNITVLVASAKDIVHSKTEANRSKDHDQLSVMRRDLGLDDPRPRSGARALTPLPAPVFRRPQTHPASTSRISPGR